MVDDTLEPLRTQAEELVQGSRSARKEYSDKTEVYIDGRDCLLLRICRLEVAGRSVRLGLEGILRKELCKRHLNSCTLPQLRPLLSNPREVALVSLGLFSYSCKLIGSPVAVFCISWLFLEE